MAEAEAASPDADLLMPAHDATLLVFQAVELDSYLVWQSAASARRNTCTLVSDTRIFAGSLKIKQSHADAQIVFS